MKSIQEDALAIKKLLSDTRRRLHSFAECGFSLPKTTEFVKSALHSMGCTPKNCGRSGIVCTLSASSPKLPAVLLRADMDALPIKEETSLAFRAENGCMHACGHDMHTAMLLGAAQLLKKHEDRLKAPVRLVFQPAEELLSGAADMKKAGVLTGVGAAFMLHAVPAVPFSSGTLLLPPDGVGAPAACFFELEVCGESAHVGESGKGRMLWRRLYSSTVNVCRKTGPVFSFRSANGWREMPQTSCPHAPSFRAASVRGSKSGLRGAKSGWYRFAQRKAKKV